MVALTVPTPGTMGVRWVTSLYTYIIMCIIEVCIVYFCSNNHSMAPILYNRNSSSLPSAFLGKRSRMSSGKLERIFTYDRDIVSIPPSFVSRSGLISIPRQKEKQEFLARNKLIGKIQLTSAMSEGDIFEEIRSVFSIPMDKDLLFQFEVLQSSGGRSKSLTIPVCSPTYKWTAGAICGKNPRVPIYILAKDKLKVSS